MRFMIAVLALFITAPLAARSAPLMAPLKTSETPAGGYVLGNPKAPVRLLEFMSFTCPHCAHFTQDGAAQLKANYIAMDFPAIVSIPQIRIDCFKRGVKSVKGFHSQVFQLIAVVQFVQSLGTICVVIPQGMIQIKKNAGIIGHILKLRERLNFKFV